MKTLRFLPILAALVLGSARPAAGGEDPAKALAKLEQAFDTTELPWKEAYEKFLAPYEEFARKHPGTDEALAARLRILEFSARWKPDEAKVKEEAARIVDGILKDYPRSEGLAVLSEWWYLFTEEKFAEILAVLEAEDQPPRVKASLLYRRARHGHWSDHREESRPLLEEILEKYRDLPLARTTFGEVADAMLHPHSPEALAVGAVAPDIVGKDVDGKPVKLSDYRGKVVLLDFFGDW